MFKKEVNQLDVLVTTPLNFLKMVEKTKENDKGKKFLDSVKYIVLDEADKYFEMGFLDQFEKLISLFKVNDVFYHLFTATMPTQIEKLIEELGLNGAKGLTTPAVKPSIGSIRADKALPPEKVTHFRALAARADYLSADRPECQFAAKEICRLMAKPTSTAMNALKRLGKYLPELTQTSVPFRVRECGQVGGVHKHRLGRECPHPKDNIGRVPTVGQACPQMLGDHPGQHCPEQW